MGMDLQTVGLRHHVFEPEKAEFRKLSHTRIWRISSHQGPIHLSQFRDGWVVGVLIVWNINFKDAQVTGQLSASNHPVLNHPSNLVQSTSSIFKTLICEFLSMQNPKCHPEMSGHFGTFPLLHHHRFGGNSPLRPCQHSMEVDEDLKESRPNPPVI